MKNFVIAALLSLSVQADARDEAFLPAIAPVDAADMEGVLRRDMEKTLTSGFLARGKPIGVSIAVLRNGQRSIFSLGAAGPHSLYEIGSITHAFTGLLLAQMVEQEIVTPRTPVRELLPAGTVAQPPGQEITLLDLVTHHSGLPWLPDNFADLKIPGADYEAANLYAFIGRHGVAKPENATFLPSNVGFGLLGQALANRARLAYPKLIRMKVLEPLGLRDTAVSLSPDQRRRSMLPYNTSLQLENDWDLSALAGAGALRSSAPDLLKYLRAQFDSRRLAGLTFDSRSLPQALRRTHALLADAQPGQRIAYAWIYDNASGTYWQNGGTFGFSSAVFFNLKKSYAGVVLANLGPSGDGHFAGALSQHIEQRFTGVDASSLDAW